jgi:hypothetical protein
MKKLMMVGLLAGSVILSGCSGKKADMETLKNQALESTLSYDLVESLTTEVGPRLVGTEGDAKGVAWAVAKFRELGFDRVWTEDVEYMLWQRGPINAEIVAPFPQKMTAIALGGSVATPKEGIEAEIVHFETYAAMEEAEAGSLKGKVAFISNRMERHRDGSGYRPAVIARSKGSSLAAEKGAVAIMIRSIGTDNNRLGHTGMTHYNEGVNRIPAVALSNPDADLLVNQLKREKPVTVRLAVGNKRDDDAVVKTANVIAEVRGSETPDEFVVLAAHLDSWDVGTGAVDDGMGVGITMAAAKLISEMPERPKRSIRVILFAAEEVGLVGAKQYLEANKDSMDQHVIGAEWDFGTQKIYRMKPGVGNKALSEVKGFYKQIRELGVEELDRVNDAKGQSDLSVLGNAGMPALNFNADGTTYFDIHHTENDTLDKVELDVMQQATAIYAMFGWFAAESSVDFRK